MLSQTQAILLERFRDRCLLNEPLKAYTTYKIGGPCDAFIYPQTIEELEFLSDFIRDHSLPFYILGAGSNILVSDEGLRGIVIKLSKFLVDSPTLYEKEHSIVTSASFSQMTLVRKAIEMGWVNFERLTGIPGTVAGAVVMNAGTSLGETSEMVIAVNVFDLATKNQITYRQNDLKFSYRKNHFLKKTDIILSVEWKKQPYDVTAGLKNKVTEYLNNRQKTQPLSQPSCGSVFKNPQSSTLKAWQVVEQCGFKGFSLGGAQVSTVHSNFIVNTGSAKASEVYQLIQMIKQKAKETLGLELQEEIHYLGKF